MRPVIGIFYDRAHSSRQVAPTVDVFAERVPTSLKAPQLSRLPFSPHLSSKTSRCPCVRSASHFALSAVCIIIAISLSNNVQAPRLAQGRLRQVAPKGRSEFIVQRDCQAPKVCVKRVRRLRPLAFLPQHTDCKTQASDRLHVIPITGCT